MINIKANKRDKSTTGYNNKLRLDGFIPAILYGGKIANEKISIAKKDVKNFIQSESFLSTVFEIDIDGKKEKVLPREVAYHVTTNEPIHLDLMRIVSGTKITIEIPVQFKNNNIIIIIYYRLLKKYIIIADNTVYIFLEMIVSL